MKTLALSAKIVIIISLLTCPEINGNLWQDLLKPLHQIEHMNATRALTSLQETFEQFELLLELALRFSTHPVLIESCQLYLIHSFTTRKYIYVIKAVVKNAILPSLLQKGKDFKRNRLKISDYIDEYFKLAPHTVMKNIALQSNDPFANAIYGTFKDSIINLQFPKRCNEIILHRAVDFGALLLMISDNVVKTQNKQPMLGNFSAVSRSTINVNDFVKSYGIKKMILNATVSDTRSFLKISDLVFLEMHRLLTSPSSLWTAPFREQFHNLFYSVTFIVGYGYLGLFIMGIIFNLVAIFFSLSTLKLSNINVYLLALAILDSCALIGNLLPLTTKFWSHYMSTKHCSTNKWKCAKPAHFADVFEYSDIGCKLVNYMVSFSRAASAWLMVSTASVRLMAVSRPLQWRNKAMKFNVKVITITVIFTAVLTSTSLLTRRNTTYWLKNYLIRYCHQNDFSFVSYSLETYVNAFVFPILPMCLLLILNGLTIYKMRCGSKLFSKSSFRTKLKNSETKSTVTLLLVSFTFVFFSMPYFINTLIQLYSKYDFQVAQIAIKHGTGPLLNLEKYVIAFVLSISNAINLFLYLLSSTAWRQKAFNDLKCIVFCKWARI